VPPGGARGQRGGARRVAVDRFGRLDALVDSAASTDAGYFEELTREQIKRELATPPLGPMTVTRADLPVLGCALAGGAFLMLHSSTGV
jgi:NAD(P)-dependent dehydrogenase (short-subunit alcohol dehydrogenase family)